MTGSSALHEHDVENPCAQIETHFGTVKFYKSSFSYAPEGLEWTLTPSSNSTLSTSEPEMGFSSDLNRKQTSLIASISQFQREPWRWDRWFSQYLEDRPPHSSPELTEFQRSVLEHMSNIGTGSLQSYGQLSGIAGHSGASRAVGSVCARNPWPFLYPCHRVVQSHELHAFENYRDDPTLAPPMPQSYAGGKEWKQYLILGEMK